MITDQMPTRSERVERGIDKQMRPKLSDQLKVSINIQGVDRKIHAAWRDLNVKVSGNIEPLRLQATGTSEDPRNTVHESLHFAGRSPGEAIVPWRHENGKLNGTLHDPLNQDSP